jgi:hypothetical protein
MMMLKHAAEMVPAARAGLNPFVDRIETNISE